MPRAAELAMRIDATIEIIRATNGEAAGTLGGLAVSQLRLVRIELAKLLEGK